MAIGLYKPGQGYWVRVLTATLIGILTLAASAWVYDQMARVADNMPRSVWAMQLAGVNAAPAPGQSVTLLGSVPAAGGQAPELGTATVDSYAPGATEVRVNHVNMKDSAMDPSLANSIKIEGGQPVAIRGKARGETSIDPRLLQGIGMTVVLLLGALLAYYVTAMHQRFVDFLIATDGEMKKVNWSTGRDIRASTGVVIGASLMLALCLFIADSAFNWFFQTIGILVH